MRVVPARHLFDGHRHSGRGVPEKQNGCQKHGHGAKEAKEELRQRVPPAGRVIVPGMRNNIEVFGQVLIRPKTQLNRLGRIFTDIGDSNHDDDVT